MKKCDKCGIEALQGEVFAQEGLPFRRAKSLCPACHARYYESVYRVLFLGCLVAGVVGLVAMVAKPQSGFGRNLFYFFILQCMLVAVTVAHELGHAFAGRWLNCQVSGIVIGWFGRVVFRCKLFGFNTVVRSVPLGGLAYVCPDSSQWMRSRQFLVVLAGPMVNAILVASFWYPGVMDHLVSAKWEALGLRGLFITANLLSLIEALVPAVYESPFGRLPSDGLALLQLGFLRRMPYAPERKKRTKLRWRKVVFGALLLVSALGCLIVVSIGIWLTILVKNSATAVLAIVTIFGAMFAALIWLTVRVWHHESTRELTAVAAHGIAGAYQQEVLQKTDAAKLAGFAELQRKLQALTSVGQRSEGDKLINAALAQNPGDVWLLLCKAAWLNDCGRMLEAAELYQILQLRTDWSAASRTTLLTEELALRAKAGATNEVRRRCEEFLASTVSVTEKVYLLDRLACLPIYGESASYLMEADRWSREALSLLPNSLTLQGTRGSILVELGKFEEAWPLLSNVVKNSSDDIDQCIGCFYLGLIAKARGDLKSVKQFARRARNACSMPAFLERISRELSA